MKIQQGFLAKAFACCLLLVGFNAHATLYVPDYGTTGNQGFTYTFDSAFTGSIVLGTSNVLDSALSPTLALSNFAGAMLGQADFTLSGNPNGTSAYSNTVGMMGTSGALWSTVIDVQAGDAISFNWNFTATDYMPFRDFSFVALFNGAGSLSYYNVLAQIGPDPVPTPAPVLLLLAGIAGLLAARKRR